VVIVLRGRPVEAIEADEDQAGVDEDLRRMLSELRQDGVRAKDAVAQVSETTGLAKNRVYHVWVELGRESG
jgi:16S rRNA C1402 (ribose-2'-O) methylase RsmI